MMTPREHLGFVCSLLPKLRFFPKMACPPYAHPMSVNFKHIQALQTRVTVWPEGPLRSRYINFLEKEIDLPVFSVELCRRILPRALSDWHTLHNPAAGLACLQ